MKVGEVYALLGMDFAQFNKDERTAKRRTETLGSSLSGVLKNAFSFTLGMGFFQAVQAGFRSTVGTMIGFNSQMEMAQIGFTTMLGSAQRAQKFLDDVANFAAKTPFEFPDLLDASKRMLAYGFAAEDVLPTMQAVGNATAAVGLGSQGIDRIILALGQMRAKGKVSGEEMRQLTETGIPAWEILAEAMGKSTAEVMDLSQRGLIPADRAIKMFTEGMNKRFPDMMSKMENTWEGVTSTIKDVWQMTIGEVTKGLFQGAVSWLQKVRDVATGFYDAFRAGGLQYAVEQTFGARTAASIGTLTAALKGLWGMVSGVAMTIVRNWTLIRNLTLGVVWAFLTFKTVTFALTAAAWATNALTIATRILGGEAIKTSLTTGFLARVIQTYNLQLHLASKAGIVHVGVLQALKTALYSLWNALGPIGWAILAICAALGIGVSLWSKYNQAVQAAAQKAQTDKMAQQQQDYVDSVNEAAKGTDNQSDALKNLGKAASKNLQSFDEIHSLASDTADLSAGALGDILGGTPTLPEMPEFDMSAFTFDMDDAIAQAKAEMGGFWGWIWDDIKNGAVNAWNGITGLLSNLWQGAVNLARPIWEPLAPFFAALWEGIKTVATTVWSVIGPLLSTIWAGIVTVAQTVWGALGTFFVGLWEGIETVATVAWGLIQYFLATAWFSIVEIAKAVWGVLGPFFSLLWEGIKAVVLGVWNVLSTVLPPIWDGLVAAAKAIWSVLEPFFSTLWAAVRWVFESVWVPLAAWLSGVWESIKTAAQIVWGLIQKVIVDPIAAAKQTVETVVEGIRSGVESAWNKTLDAVKAVKDWLYKYLVEPFQKARDFIDGVITAAKDWGKNFIDNIVGGIKAGIDWVVQAGGAVAGAIKKFLGFSSPTKEGPGRYADQWAPNLMRMYAKGILDNISMVQSAASQVTRSLMPMTAVPAPAFAGMGDVGRFGMGRGGGLADELAAALRGVGGIGGNRPIEVILNIDSRRMARVLIPAIQSEQDRIEADTIVRVK